MRRFQPRTLLATRRGKLAALLTALAMAALVAMTLGINFTHSVVEAQKSSAPIAVRPSAAQPKVVASGIVDMSKLSKVAAQSTQQPSQPAPQPPLPLGQTAASIAASQNALRHMKGVPVVKGQIPPTQLAPVDNANPTDGISPKFIGGTQLLPTLSKSFDGLNATQTNGGIASPSIAVNLGYAVEAAMGTEGNGQNANSGGIAIYNTSTGALAYGPYGSHSFFAPIYTAGNSLNDPQVLYDTSRDRWIIVYVEWNPTFSQSWLDVAISQTMSPTQPSPGAQYYEYKITANPFNSPNANICRWSRLGMDYWGLWITCLSQDTSAAPSFYAAGVFALNKNQFYAGASGYVASWGGVPIDTMCGGTHCNAVEASPAVEDGTPDAEWIVANNQDIPGAFPSKNLTLCAATNTIGLTTATLPTLTCGFNTLPQSYAGVLSPQVAPCVEPCPSSFMDIQTNINQVVYRGSRLFTAWATVAMFDGDSENRDGVYWLEVLPQLSTRAAHNPQQVNGLIVQNQGVYGYKGAYAFSPTLAPSAELDEALVFNFSSETTGPSIVFTARRGRDAPNTMGQGSPNGASAGVVWGAHLGGPSIWGPFSSCSLALNSVTRGSIWCAAEYVGSDNWNTRIFAIRME